MSRNVCHVRKPAVQSRNLWSKPELEVVLASTLGTEGSYSLENASKRPQKAITTDASETA